MSVADEIKKLGELRDSGLLTDEEFATQKAKYQAYVAELLHLLNWPDADARARGW